MTNQATPSTNISYLTSTILLISTLFLTSCGGGEGGNGSVDNSPNTPTPSNTVIISGNANSNIILDANNKKYSITKNTSTVVELSTNTSLTGLTVDSSLNVLSNGTPVGAIILNLDSSGRTVARLMYNYQGKTGPMIIDLTQAGWNVSCSGCTASQPATPAPSTSPNPSNSPDGINASQCISIIQNNGSASITNSCSKTIYATWCGTSTEYSTDACSARSQASVVGTFTSYGAYSSSITSGRTISTTTLGKVYGTLYVFACAKGPSGAEPFPYITQLNPILGVCI